MKVLNILEYILKTNAHAFIQQEDQGLFLDVHCVVDLM